MIVAMAATFERQPSVYIREVIIDQPFIPKGQPLVYQHEAGITDSELLTTLMGNTTGDWMYTALDELTLGTSPPPWSRDGWSFTPIDLTLLPNTTLRQTVGKHRDIASSADLIFSESNVTIYTTAMVADLDCQVIEVANSSPFSVNETNGLIAELTEFVDEPPDDINLTGYPLPRLLLDGTNYQTTLSNTPLRVVCCANRTDDDKHSVVAYWSHIDSNLWWTKSRWDGFGPLKWPGSLMLKWIVGPAETTAFDIYTNGLPTDYTLMYYTSAPEVRIASCQPAIYASEAIVTVARSSG